jgi:hypothetical protein
MNYQNYKSIKKLLMCKLKKNNQESNYLFSFSLKKLILIKYLIHNKSLY